MKLNNKKNKNLKVIVLLIFIPFFIWLFLGLFTNYWNNTWIYIPIFICLIFLLIVIIKIIYKKIKYKNLLKEKFDFFNNFISNHKGKIYKYQDIKNILKSKNYQKQQGIYLLFLKIDDINKFNKLPIYIGQSFNLIERFDSHVEYLRDYDLLTTKKIYENLTEILKIFNLTYQDINFIILERTTTYQSKLDFKEEYWVNYFSSYYFGLNQTKNGK